MAIIVRPWSGSAAGSPWSVMARFGQESPIGQTKGCCHTYHHARVLGGGVMPGSGSIVERPMRPTCKHRMGLARISPGKRGFEQRIFECSTCHRTEIVSFPVDPMKTDAVGWLAGDLKPPR